MAKEASSQGLSHNIIAQGTTIVGTISTDNDIRIDGTIEGDLRCKGKVVIGEQGSLKGNIECENAEIMGRINGELVITGLLSLKSTANIYGKIKTKVLSIEPEAQFSGTCDMANQE